MVGLIVSDLIEATPLLIIPITFQTQLTCLSVCLQEDSLVETPAQLCGCKNWGPRNKAWVGRGTEGSGRREGAWEGGGVREGSEVWTTLGSETMTHNPTKLALRKRC